LTRCAYALPMENNKMSRVNFFMLMIMIIDNN
jgi:hypothetical protein